jgi:hypothetical protein
MDSQATDPARRDVSRLTAGLLASGIYATLIGVVFFFPLTLDSLFAASDEGMSNFVFGALLFLIGSTLLIASWAGFGLPWWGALLLALANLALVLLLGAVLVGVLRLGFAGTFYTLTADAVILLGVSLWLAVASARARAWIPAVLLGAAGVALVALIYALAAPRFAVVCCAQPLPLPYVAGSIAALSVSMTAVVFLVAILVEPLVLRPSSSA